MNGNGMNLEIDIRSHSERISKIEAGEDLTAKQQGIWNTWERVRSVVEARSPLTARAVYYVMIGGQAGEPTVEASPAGYKIVLRAIGAMRELDMIGWDDIVDEGRNFACKAPGDASVESYLDTAKTELINGFNQNAWYHNDATVYLCTETRGVLGMVGGTDATGEFTLAGEGGAAHLYGVGMNMDFVGEVCKENTGTDEHTAHILYIGDLDEHGTDIESTLR